MPQFNFTIKVEAKDKEQAAEIAKLVEIFLSLPNADLEKTARKINKNPEKGKELLKKGVGYLTFP